MDSYIARSSKQVGAALRSLRKQAKLTQSELSQRVSMRQATISEIESADASTKLETLFDVLGALDLEIVIRKRSKDEPNLEDIF